MQKITNLAGSTSRPQKKILSQTPFIIPIPIPRVFLQAVTDDITHSETHSSGRN
jgi:hypothetical protein